MPLIKLLHASIAEVAVNCSSGCFRSSRRLDTHLSRPCDKGPAHPLAALRASIWPNYKVVTLVLGPSLIDLLPGACFLKSQETFKAQTRQIVKSKPVEL